MVSLVAGIACLLIAVRVFVAITVETAMVFHWPLILSDCPKGCNGKPYPDLCIKSCELRSKINLDMKDYLAVDPLTAKFDLFTQIIVWELTFIITPLMVLAAFGLLARTSWAKKLLLRCKTSSMSIYKLYMNRFSQWK